MKDHEDEVNFSSLQYETCNTTFSTIQGCQFGYFEAKFVIFGLFSTPLDFFQKWKKAKWNSAFFGHIDFSCQFGGFRDDFDRFLGTGRFLDT